MLDRKKVISILNNEYSVSFPNSGQELDIILAIQRLSAGRYESLKFSAFDKIQREALKIETIAHFTVLIPKLEKDLNVKSLFDLERDQMQILINAYTEQLYPWLEEWEIILSKPKEEKKDGE